MMDTPSSPQGNGSTAPSKPPKIVGQFIRQRRETLGLSQRALGLLFTPPVTTQFISNVERGVTPLPPAHVPILAEALKIAPAEIMALLEREYAMKLSGRLGRAPDGEAAPGNGHSNGHLEVQPTDFEFMRGLYDAFKTADPKTREAFLTVASSMLGVPKGAGGNRIRD